jgi:cell division protein FtsW
MTRRARDSRRRGRAERNPSTAPGTRPSRLARALGGDGFDGAVLTAITLLASFGVVMIYSASAPLALDATVSPYFTRHVTAIVLAIAIAAVVTRVPLRAFRAAALALWIAGVALLVATLWVGVSVNGARRWLEVPGVVRFQPAEIAKWATVLALAAVLSHPRPRNPRLRDIALPAALATIPAALLLLQPDLGNSVLVLLSAGLLLFVAGTPIRFLAAGLLTGTTGLLLYVGRNAYALARWNGFLNPWETSQGPGFQLVQSFAAFGHGGLLGVGLGDSRQKLFYLPEAHTDFILSVVAEELGLIGVLVVLGAFAALLIAGTRIAMRARDPFALLAAFGMTSLLTVPAAVNAAVVTGMLPTKGLPLPFLSYGRTSLVVCFASLGILLAVARETRPARTVAGAIRRGVRAKGRAR